VPPPWLNTLVVPMDDEGFVYISPEPGLGYVINWNYINSHMWTDRPIAPAVLPPGSAAARSPSCVWGLGHVIGITGRR